MYSLCTLFGVSRMVCVCASEMSGLPYFAIQIQSWIFITQSNKSNRNPKSFQNPSPKNVTKHSFLKTKITQYFPLTQSKSGSDPKFLNQFNIRIQSKFNKIRHSPDPSSPVQCSSLVRVSTYSAPCATRLHSSECHIGGRPMAEVK